MPIIESLLDIDFYKFTMGQLVFHRYPDIPVRYGFKNRTSKVNLADFIDEHDLRRELDHARTLRFNSSELHYLRGTDEYGDRMFTKDYLEFLGTFQLPEYCLAKRDGMYILEFPGKWFEAIYWETIALAIVNELYYRTLMARLSRFERDTVYAEGKLRLAKKISVLRDYPRVKFSDFGTRRRFARAWQDYEIGVLAEEVPNQFLGTSNVFFANKHGVMPMGTCAHEPSMVMPAVMAASDEEVRASQNKVLQDWWEEYGQGLSIALTDTWGTDFFFRDMTREQAHAWKGLRQDSGDPFAFGERAIEFYENHGVNPREKLLIFSDGLDVEIIVRVFQRFSERINVSFGWGTNLTNDLGFPALSLVVKVIEACGRGTVKLSDNLAKATGSPEDIERIKRIAGYSVTLLEECKY